MVDFPLPFFPNNAIRSPGLATRYSQSSKCTFRSGVLTVKAVGFLSVYLYEPCITPGGGPGLRFESFQAVTIVAANGDAITADTNVSGCSDGVSGTEPAGNYTITGGTGRFAGASGTGTIDAVALGTSLSTEWAGTISY